MHIVLFFSLFLLIMGGANLYIYRRFLRRLTPRLNRLAWLIPTLLMLGETLFILDNLLHFLPQSTLLYLINAAFIGITFMLFVLATCYDLLIATSRRVPVDQERRRFIKQVFDVTMLVAASAYLLRGLSQGLRNPPVKQTVVAVPGVRRPGFSIVQLSDVHVGRTIRGDFVADLVARTNQLAPDIVAITGDLVDLPVERIRADLAPLADLQAPAYFILGNHEYFHGPQAAVEYLRSLGIIPLLNQRVPIKHAGQTFNLVGINDLMGQRMGALPADIPLAFAECDPELPTIVLAHQPKTIELVAAQRCDLMLSGHTHGGQIFPFGFLVMIDQPYLSGLHQHNPQQQIFVSRGAGYWGPPLRFLAPNEINHILIEPA